MSTPVFDAAWTREKWVRCEANSVLSEMDATLKEASSLEERLAALADAEHILTELGVTS